MCVSGFASGGSGGLIARFSFVGNTHGTKDRPELDLQSLRLRFGDSRCDLGSEVGQVSIPERVGEDDGLVRPGVEGSPEVSERARGEPHALEIRGGEGVKERRPMVVRQVYRCTPIQSK